MTGRERAALLGLAALLAVLAIAAPGFFAADNLRDLALANAPVLVVALGMTLVVIAGHVDVSVGATFAVLAVVAGVLARDGWPMPVVTLAALAGGAAVGLVNGLLSGPLRLPSIVVTLAMLVVLRDGLRWLTDGAWVRQLPGTFQWFGLGQAAGQALILAAAAALAVVVHLALQWLTAGRAIYATGSNLEAARLAGLRPGVVVVGAFVACNVLVGAAALLNAIRFAEVQGSVVAGLEMKVIAAVIVGGAAITGGRGSIAGTVTGVALLGAIGTGLTFLGVSAYWERAVQGAIILAALVADAAFARRAKAAR